MPDFRKAYSSVVAAMRSRRGHDILLFLVFVCLSALLWCVQALNQEDQADVRIPIRITNVPDSVTLVTLPPATVSASIRARGTQLLKLGWGMVPTVDIDFRIYKQGDYVRVGDADIKALIRNKLDGSSVLVVAPDSLVVGYTTSRGVMLPVVADYAVSAGPKAALTGAPRLSLDSVRVFSMEPLPRGTVSVATEPIRISDLNETTVRSVRIVAPPKSRVVPDSVMVTFDVEPLIFKTRRVNIEPVNVPAGIRLITFPSQIDVIYMLPVSVYKNSEPSMRVVADYSTIDRANPTNKVRIKVTNLSTGLQNVHLEADSAEYIIEQL